MGAVDIVKRYVPASYRALVGVTNNYYNATDLQALADTVQFRLFATVSGATLEDSVFTRTELDLLGTVTTLQFIPAAIDYWGDVLQSEGTSGTEENVTFFDRRPELWRVYDVLAQHAAELAVETGINVKKIKTMLPQVTYGDNGRGILVTPDPNCFDRQYSDVVSEDLIEWTYPD